MALEIDRATREPVMPPLSPPAKPAAPPANREPLLIAAQPDGADLGGVSAAMAPLAELCASELAQTPFRVGIIGPPGAGKSFALARLSAAIADLGSRVPGAGVSRPREIVMATVDAAGFGADGFDPASALASAVYVALEVGSRRRQLRGAGRRGRPRRRRSPPRRGGGS